MDFAYTVTVDGVMELRPCRTYPRTRVESLWAGRDRIGATGIAALEIPAKDRLWLLFRIAPQDVWMPAIWYSVERSIQQASRTAGAAGSEWADRLALLEPVASFETCRAVVPILRAYADAAYAAATAATAAAATAATAYAATAATAAYAYAAADAAADALEITVAHVARLIEDASCELEYQRRHAAATKREE